MLNSDSDLGDCPAFEYIINHVFCPLQLPDGDDHSVSHDRFLAEVVVAVANLYFARANQVNTPVWRSILQTLDNLHAIVQFQTLDRSQTTFQLTSMDVGDVVAFMIRAQNAAVVFRKQGNVTIFESFELSPKAEDVMTTQGKLLCSYPGPAIEIPNTVFDDDVFRSELVNFLVHMNDDVLPGAAPTTHKASSTVLETRDTTNPRYITELLTGILRSVGHPAQVARISKRVGDEVVWNNSKLPWRRSSLWLLIRVVIQTTLDRSPLGRVGYKEFMLFFMCHIGKEGRCADLRNDLVHLISAKISRRLRKLGPSAPDWLSRMALDTCTSLRLVLEERWTWQVLDTMRSCPSWTPSQLDLNRDIQLSLLGSGDYIRTCLTSCGVDSPGTDFSPQHRPRGSLDDFLSSDGTFSDEAYRAEPYVILYDVELAVEEGIDGWVDRVTNNDQACVRLEILAQKYSTSALRSYGNNPELLSVMLLTVVELWVALDKIAIREIPMLAEYSPEIPINLLESLLLYKSASLHRLRLAHQYISHRYSQSNSNKSAFSCSAAADSFAVRYYRGSSELQHLKARIEEAAQRDVEKKVAQLEKSNARHTELKQKCISTDHSSAVTQDGREFHPKKCTKCRLEKKLGRMDIAIYEWPLPVGNLAEVVSFELDCPVSFNMWRSATFHLLVDLCSPSQKPKDPYMKLDRYAALHPYLVQHPRSRISLGSDAKPFVVSHYNKVSIPATQKRVCVNNGLKFSGFDSQARVPVSEALGRVNVGKYCTHQLQSGPYQNLQKYVDSTAHTSNEVMANQFDCHKDLPIHEFVAFAHLRSSGSLQWLNILRELRGRSLTFRRHEVHSLIVQAVSQIGPLSDMEWVWHQEIRQLAFCEALIEELESLLRDVKANWLEGVTMDTISFLLGRLLASSPDRAILQKALGLLRAVRERVFSWVTQLSSKISGSCEDEELRGLLRDTAAICRSTFDVDPSMIREVLSSEQDIAMLLSSSIRLHDNTPGKVSSLPPHSQLLLDRDRRLSLALESVLRDSIRTRVGNRGIDLAVAKVWSSFRQGSRWSPLKYPNSRWLTCRTAPTENQCSQVVHFNLLDGSLLVDGKPLGRLPHGIRQHSLYNQIFGKQVLDVIPAALPGMDYSTRDAISGHQVFFALKNDDLIIRAVQVNAPNAAIFELIPPEKLVGDLPAVLINGHIHWLNVSTSVLEIRPLDKPWETSAENWTIDCSPGRYLMRRGRELLMDIRGQSWAMVSRLLEPLETSQNLLVTYSPIDPRDPSSLLQLSVDLPRYGLSFFVDEDGDLQSHNIRDMVYDKDQSIGTMFGLVNQLVLRPKSRKGGLNELVPRCVLIPEGDISFQMDDHHVRVEVDTKDRSRITYQTYRVNTDLGCLTGNVSLTNKLYCAYLHALTSGCSTDPLTGRLGTEEALTLLRSANCWSIMKFSARDAELLGLIASLCPSRAWYPEQLKCMQRVEWLSLPATSQHHELYILANEIKKHYERIQLFQESPRESLFQSFPTRDQHLLNRGALRAAHLFPSEFSGVPSGVNYDVRYPSRDVVAADPASGEYRAYMAASTVHYRAASPAGAKFIKGMVKSWSNATVLGSTPLSLQYDRSWLNPNLSSIWLEMYNQLRTVDEGEWMQLFFTLPAMAYVSPALCNLIPAFVAFAMEEDFDLEDPPGYDSYNLSDGDAPSPAILCAYIASHAHAFERSPESTEPAKSGESFANLHSRQHRMYDKRLESDAKAMVHQLLLSWPEGPSKCLLDTNLYDAAALTLDIESYFSSCYRNLKLRQHLTRVQNILKGIRPQTVPSIQYSFHPSQNVPSQVAWLPAIHQLLVRLTPVIRLHDKLPRYTTGGQNVLAPNSAPLHQLIAMAEVDATSLFQIQYASALRSSAESLEKEKRLVTHGSSKKPTTERLRTHYAQCRDRYIQGMEQLRQSLGPRDKSEHALEQSGQWPRITAHVLFRILASNSTVILSDAWKKCLTRLALLVLELQRARRLLRLHLDDRREEFFKESENEGCDGWAASEHPDWLLIQLQGNFLIRRVQVDVANEMISPRSGKNTAMQLNMGEGKSSVIVPISVAALADGGQMVRVIVPKALTSQMFQLLVDRLGGLTNRRIYFLPFSRSVEIDPERIAILREVMVECMNNHGILIVQPEHVLSLKLVTVEKQLPQAQNSDVSSQILELQKWVHSHSRDILDESDEILHVRYELVYTIGNQQHIEGFPNRWINTQQILGLVSKHARFLRELYPLGVEYERGPPGSFARLRILQLDTAGRNLISWLVQDIMDGRLANFNFGQLRPELRDAIRGFISRGRIPHTKMRLVEEYAKESPQWSGLLLLRGLLATGILLFAFKERRWRVDYGLSLTRTMLAVPYRAKDVPAQRAEFGHPDVAVVLTCLSYYYGGLNEEQLKASFEILLKQDDPSQDYELWTKGCSSVPESLVSLSGINLKSSEQWRKGLFPLFSRNKATIDFYLSRVVFPREAKEFPWKLSCSGWDLAEERDHLLTGFSGTNDGQYLLPLHITQHDADHQRGTNAKVLAYLLQPENNHYMCITHDGGGRRTTRQFLDILAQKPEIRVLLDVGAQMLDLQNCDLAKAWLAVSPDSSAAIYFSEDDELTVLTRDGGTQLFLSSPFAQQLDQCIIYLDDAHTRGTDINFPSGFRAAVTLGPGVTKDRLAQGCMRMRKLGHGHSIMFFAPLEVDRRIRYVAGKGPSSGIGAMDILQWAIRETCDDIQLRAPHWAQQGMNHASRSRVWSSFSEGKLDSEQLSTEWLQPEAKKLQDLYGPRHASHPLFPTGQAIRERCIELGVLSLARTTSMDEEQEREVIHEAERERQVERPPKVPPAIHSMHPDVAFFVKTGAIPTDSKVFRPAFKALVGTPAATHEAHVWSPSVLVTNDFANTVKSSKNVGEYLRPVQWVVSAKRSQKPVFVMLSPYEIDHLISDIRSSAYVHLHLYTPRVFKSMKPCDDLALYSIPTVRPGWTAAPLLMDQLNMFAGQLYIRDYETYIRICRFLCVYVGDLDNDQGFEIGSDGFIAPKNRPRQRQASPGVQTFQTSPLESLKVLVGLRRKGVYFAPTHLGKLLDGLPLSQEADFDGGDADSDNDEDDDWGNAV